LPTDYKTQVYNQLWTLAEAYPALAALIRVGNRLKLTTQAGWLKELFLNRRDADLPSLSISTGRFTNSAFTTDPTFDEEDPNFLANGGSWIVTRTAEFTAKIVNRLDVGEMDPVEEAFQIALLKGGPKLAFSSIKTWGPMTATQIVDSRNEGRGVARLVTTITIPITMIFDGQTLVSQT
jgi:hypothetical protein